MNRDDEQEEPSNSFAAAGGPRIYALEIEDMDDDDEEEEASLLRETRDAGHAKSPNGNSSSGSGSNFWTGAVLQRNVNFRHRAPRVSLGAAAANGSSSHAAGSVLGLLRSGIGRASSLRNVALLTLLAATSLLILYALDADFLNQKALRNAPNTVWKTPHGPSLGGNLNTGHYHAPPPDHPDDDDAPHYGYGYGEDDWYWNGDDNTDNAANNDDLPDRLPKSNVGARVDSISEANRQNAAGHYLHDVHKSPYASPYYKSNSGNTTAMEQIQAQFEAQMASCEIRYGRYVTPAFGSELTVPAVNHTIRYRDAPALAATDWPLDAAYVQNFLLQAKLLVGRVKEGIYEEYGYGTAGVTSTAQKGAILGQRLPAFRVIVGDDDLAVDDAGTARDRATGVKLPGVAHLNAAAWEALIRKLLHCLVTGDEFYVVAAGSAATYRGNNFAQSAVMQFDYILQPVFDKLGVRLISRNMGMAAPTAIAALAGADVYGEADIFWHTVRDDDDDGGEESTGEADLLHRQAILSGERVPVILTPDPASLAADTDNAVWVGNLQPGADFCERTRYENGSPVLPSVPACHYVNCDNTGADTNNNYCDVHNSVCWVERSDQAPQTEQRGDVGHQREGYPSPHAQRLEGRKLAMLVLHALDEALDRWMEQSEMGVLPLPNEFWHVGPAYEAVRETVRTLPGGGACDRLLGHLDPQICHMEMHAYTEWTPRVLPNRSRLKRLVQGEIADNHATLLEVYKGVDLLPPQWKLSDDEVDVHMIAIATDSDSLPPGSDENAVVVSDDDANGFPWPNDDDGTWMDAEDDDFGFNDDSRRRELNPSSLGQRRELLTHDVSNKAWTVFNAPLGFCDGSAQSTCNRIISNPCLLANYNHYRAGIMGHAKSGKLKLSIPSVKEGLILARFEWDLEPDGPRMEKLPSDFVFEYTVNGKTTTQDLKAFVAATVEVTPGVRLHTFMKDYEMSQNEGETKTIEIEMEVRSEISETTPLILLSHIYYA